MAIRFNKSNENIKVIVRSDDALMDDLTDAEWSAYQESYDETKLRFKETAQPTRFVMRKHLPFAAQQAIANQQIGLTPDGKAQFQLGFILEEVRCGLVDIVNPSNIPEDQKLKFEKDGDGFAARELCAFLHEAGIAMELYGARQSAARAVTNQKK